MCACVCARGAMAFVCSRGRQVVGALGLTGILLVGVVVLSWSSGAGRGRFGATTTERCRVGAIYGFWDTEYSTGKRAVQDWKRTYGHSTLSNSMLPRDSVGSVTHRLGRGGHRVRHCLLRAHRQTTCRRLGIHRRSNIYCTNRKMAMLLLSQSTSFAPATVHRASSAVRMEASLNGPSFAETLPGVTGPLGFFVRARAHMRTNARLHSVPSRKPCLSLAVASLLRAHAIWHRTRSTFARTSPRRRSSCSVRPSSPTVASP